MCAEPSVIAIRLCLLLALRAVSHVELRLNVVTHAQLRATQERSALWESHVYPKLSAHVRAGVKRCASLASMYKDVKWSWYRS